MEEKDSLTPIEKIEKAYQGLEQDVKSELLQEVLRQSPAFFERLVVKLLSAMGYGKEGALAKAIGKTGDGGIDGIIHQDRLGLDVVYIQAKQYDPEKGIGRPALQGFVGSLAGNQAAKGVFVTTSHFSKQAMDYLKTIQTKVITIDGIKLVDLMVEYDVGVRISNTFLVKQIDEDFFNQ